MMLDCQEAGLVRGSLRIGIRITPRRTPPEPRPLSLRCSWIARMRDWCVSRQLWWGHRIPAFYYTLKGEAEAPAGSPSERTDHWVVAADSREAQLKIQERHPGQEIALLEQVSAVQSRVLLTSMQLLEALTWRMRGVKWAQFSLGGRGIRAGNRRDKKPYLILFV